MRRLAISLLLLVCALAGAASAAAVGGTNPLSLITTTTTAGSGPPATVTGTPTAPTTTVPTTTTTTPTATTQPVERVAAGVRVGGVDVGGLREAEALARVREAFSRPLPLLVAGRRLAPRPTALGAVAYASAAVRRALTAPPGTRVALLVRVRGALVRAYVARLGKRFDRTPADSVLRLRNLRPSITRERAGRTLHRAAATRAIVGRLLKGNRAPLTLRLTTIRPAVTRASFGPIVVIRRGSKRLFLYEGMRYRRVFGVATGQSSYPTPLGRFSIITMQRNPWWYPPASEWAEGLEPVPPGPGNPLGTRWMGISSPGVGIHGTPDSASIGYSASHGCVRMLIPDAERLFGLVRVGTPVFIVGA